MNIKEDVAIFGVMGSGKSSVGRMLSERLNYKFFEESFLTCPTLEKYYEHPAKYALETELWFFREKACQHIEIGKFEGSTVQDSPIQATVGVFVNAMHSMGILKDRELSLLNDLYLDFISPMISKPSMFVYLDTSVDVLVERVKKRGREFEKTCDVRYLEASVKAANTLVDFSVQTLNRRYDD
jgi:deoxyadenosine/deoxycytidine kinase